jgi:geranylgeranylglycerol-phosphate geranylgeranyltransferase
MGNKKRKQKNNSKKITSKAKKIIHSGKTNPLTLKEKTKAYLELGRIQNAIMAGIAILIGYFLSGGNSALIVLMTIASGMMVCSGGQAINDYFDSEIDSKKEKTRPIPLGKITKQKALYFSIILFLLGILLAFAINSITALIALVFAVLLIAYPLFMNKVKYLGNYLVAAGTGITFIYGAAATGTMPNIIGFLSATAFLANLAREITKDIQDIEKDKGAKRTLPIIAGKNISKIFVFFYYLLSIIGAISAYIILQLNNYFLGFTILTTITFTYAYYLLLKNNPKKSQKYSKIGMIFSLAGFVLIVL